MSRFFAKITDDEAIVSGEEAAHMVRTLRMKEGEGFIAIDGSGYQHDCVILEASQQHVRAQVKTRSFCEAEPKIRLTLYQAYPKSAKIETILQKCVEIGINTFVPFISQYCVKRPEKDDVNKINRLQRVAAEAVKQSGRALLPEVHPFHTMNEVHARLKSHELCILAWEAEKDTSLKHVLKNHAGVKDIALIIGSEGGFAHNEAMAMREAGAVPVTLGRRILRTETAGMAAAAMIFYELDEVRPN